MTKCASSDCEEQTNPGYKYCGDCYSRWQQKQSTGQPKSAPMSSGGQWHEDPVADALLKLNSNIGKIALTLKSIEFALTEQHMNRTKDKMNED